MNNSESAAISALNIYFKLCDEYFAAEKDSRKKSKNSGLQFVLASLVLLVVGIFYDNEKIWLYLLMAFGISLIVHYQLFIYRESLSANLKCRMEIYKSHLVAMGVNPDACNGYFATLSHQMIHNKLDDESLELELEKSKEFAFAEIRKANLQ